LQIISRRSPKDEKRGKRDKNRNVKGVPLYITQGRKILRPEGRSCFSYEKRRHFQKGMSSTIRRGEKGHFFFHPYGEKEALTWERTGKSDRRKGEITHSNRERKLVWRKKGKMPIKEVGLILTLLHQERIVKHREKSGKPLYRRGWISPRFYLGENTTTSRRERSSIHTPRRKTPHCKND